MPELKFLQKISKRERFLIDYSNLKDDLIPYQNLKTKLKELLKIVYEPHKGIPLLLPDNLEYFDYKKKNFNLDKLVILKEIFRTKNFKYIHFQNYIEFGEIFNNEVKIKKNFLKTVNDISNFNSIAKKKINEINYKYKNTCAFQTRNIPHMGHEKIIELLLNKFDHVVINPVIGPKKKGDVKFEVLQEAYNFIIKNKFCNKLSYIPIIANMFYAGPREAIHHANIRQNLGFKNFVVGRDHAGAFGNYKSLDAYRLVSKFKKKLKINIITLKGAYFCQDCKKISIGFDCRHINYRNISGTEFRKKLETKKTFFLADKQLQNKLHKLKKKLFV